MRQHVVRLRDRQRLYYSYTPDTMANNIHSSQLKFFERQALICSHPTYHLMNACLQLDNTIGKSKKVHPRKKNLLTPPLTSIITKITYDKCLKNLSKGETPRPNEIPKDILNTPSNNFHIMIFVFFLQCYHQESIHKEWKHSITILLHMKDNPTIVTNFKPILLACTIYKIFTSTLKSQFTHEVESL